MNSHDAKLAAAAREIGQWSTGADPDAQLKLLGHDPAVIEALSDGVTIGFVRSLLMTGRLSTFNVEQSINLAAISSTCWVLGMLAAEVAYRQDERDYVVAVTTYGGHEADTAI